MVNYTLKEQSAAVTVVVKLKSQKLLEDILQESIVKTVGKVNGEKLKLKKLTINERL